jgi:predicted AlkP superfamily pyrophosphatase or phosphodiesterase
MRFLASALFCFAAACAASPNAGTAASISSAEPRGPIRHVVLVTVDGLVPDSYLHPDAHGLKTPALRYIVENGAVGSGARSVFPSVTYPSHTSMATGVFPARHGVTTNLAFDPLEKNLGGWRWYAEDLKSPPLWALARRAGYKTALVSWPATVGAEATWLFPEYWRARNDEDRKLLRAVSTPGFLDDVARVHADFYANLFPEPNDEAIGDIATYVLGHGKPHLTMVHLVNVDQAQHAHGLWSTQATYAIENADRQLGRMLESARGAGLWPHFAIVVASDHGFAAVTRRLRPGVLLCEAGLVRLNDKNEPVDWKAVVLPSSGSAYVYLRSPDDAATREAVRQLFAEKLRAANGGIARIYEADAIAAAGGDPRAFLALEASDGAYFASGYAGAYESPAAIAATHGYNPERPAMQASLLVLGAGIAKGPIVGARLVDIAPTIAGWLGLSMPDVDGRALFH